MKKLLAAVSTIALALSLSGCYMFGGATPAEGEQAQSNPYMIFIYLGVMVLFVVAMYFIAIRPERKREKEQKALLSTLTVGDTVLTTSGFYGVVIDITNDTVIVEFGNNKNCRIPMQKAAIVQLEHPEGYVAPEPETPPAEEKKGLKLFGRKKDKEAK